VLYFLEGVGCSGLYIRRLCNGLNIRRLCNGLNIGCAMVLV